MQGLIEELAAKKSEPGSVARKIGDLYNMAMDTVKLNGDGSTPIQPVLEKIKAVKTPKEMVTLVAEMTRQGFGPYFGIYIGPDDMNSSMNLVQTYQGGLGLGDRVGRLGRKRSPAGCCRRYGYRNPIGRSCL